MKTENGKWKITLVAILLLLGIQTSFALETSLGIELGEKVHWTDGNPYNAHSVALSFDFEGEKFGFKPFFGFSFSTAESSNMNKNVVTYNYTTKTCVETLGVKPYYIFRKSEKSSSYIGILFALNFHQNKTVKDTSEYNEYGNVYEISKTDSLLNYMTGELGLFIGNKWNASEKLTFFVECDFSSRLFATTTTYEVGGKAVDNYQSSMFGGGGTSSWALYVTPRQGIAYRF